MVPLMFALLLSGQTAVAEQALIEWKFDQTTLRRGDIAYCRMRLVNRSQEARELPMNPVPPELVSFQIRLVGTEFLPGADELTWRTGGGGWMKPYDGLMPPGEGRVTWLQVPLLTPESLHAVQGQPRAALATGGIFSASKYLPKSKPILLKFEGDISKHADKLDVVALTNVPFKEMPDLPEGWWDKMRNVPRFTRISSLYYTPSSFNEPARLRWLRDQLVEDTAVYRAVSITLALQEVAFAKQADKLKKLDAVVAEIERCGPAEREWFVRHAGSELGLCRDDVGERLFKERYPSSGRPFEVISASRAAADLIDRSDK